MTDARALPEFRVRTRVSDDELESKIGKILTPDDFNVIPTGDVKVLKPDGRVLLVYRQGIIPQELRDQAYPVLHSLRNELTTNRGLASGTPRLEGASGKRSYAMGVPSSILGAFEAKMPTPYCRLTAWTGREVDAYQELWPLLRFIGERMSIDTPDRYQAQMEAVAATQPDWVIPDTPFTTVTVNNTYPTGVHKDKGDLDEGISTLAVFREGTFDGGILVFPEYRIGVRMGDRDLLLMDAHSWHGNTQFDPPVKREHSGRLAEDPGFERISLVSYFRTGMVKCGAAADEQERRRTLARERDRALVGD